PTPPAGLRSRLRGRSLPLASLATGRELGQDGSRCRRTGPAAEGAKQPARQSEYPSEQLVRSGGDRSPQNEHRGNSWSVASHAAVGGTWTAVAIPARRPSAGAKPGR